MMHSVTEINVSGRHAGWLRSGVSRWRKAASVAFRTFLPHGGVQINQHAGSHISLSPSRQSGTITYPHTRYQPCAMGDEEENLGEEKVGHTHIYIST